MPLPLGEAAVRRVRAKQQQKKGRRAAARRYGSTNNGNLGGGTAARRVAGRPFDTPISWATQGERPLASPLRDVRTGHGPAGYRSPLRVSYGNPAGGTAARRAVARRYGK